MRAIFWLIIVFSVMVSGCRSVKTTSTTITTKKDSTSLIKSVDVHFDTSYVKPDTSYVEAYFNVDTSGEVTISNINQQQTENIRINYTIEKLPTGKARIKVQAITPERKLISQKTKETVDKYLEHKDSQMVSKEKVVKKIFNWWNMTWIIPIILIIIVIYLKRKTLLKYLPF